MTIHLIKLAVGIETITDLQTRQDWMRTHYGQRLRHVTRMTPRRQSELLDGGSLYWVIKGHIAARQIITEFEEFYDDEDIKRCRIFLDDELIRTRPQTRRPFQGWRYLPVADAPADINPADRDDDMPETMRAELTALGLL